MRRQAGGGRAGRRGFSLIEVLMVLAIVLAIVGILMPVLGRVRSWVQVVQCQDHMRYLALATLHYATDHDRYLPRPNSNSRDDGPGVPGGVKTGWAYHGKRWVTDGQPALEDGAFWPYILRHEIYRCPSHDPNYFSTGTQVLSSYTMNRLVINPVWTFRVTQYKASDIFFWETDETSSWWNDLCNYPWEGLPAGRHGTGGTVVNADGSTEWLTHGQFYDESPVVPTRPTRFWNSPGSSNGNNPY